MSLFFKRGETVNSKFVFIDSVTNETLNIINPMYRIVHYENENEIIDVLETSMDSVPGRTGEYIVAYIVPDTAIENMTYFIYASGTHPTEGLTTELEDSFKVISPDYFQSGNGGGLTIQFSAPC